ANHFNYLNCLLDKITSELDKIIKQEKNNPTIFKHHINSYLTNLPVDYSNTELVNIIQYFKSYKNYLPLFEDVEFPNDFKISVKCEMIDNDDLTKGINYRESLFHNHDFFEIIYVYNGFCDTIIKNKKIHIKSHEICIFNLQAVHKLIIPNEDCIIFNILISKKIFTKVFCELFQGTNFIIMFYINSIYNKSQSSNYFIIALDSMGKQYIDNLILEYINKDKYYQSIMESNLVSLLFYVTRYLDNQIFNDDRSEINDILKYIYENYNDLTLNQLADHFGYSNRTIMRYLKKYLNTNFTNIINECRLNNAIEYLIKTDYSIDEIAHLTGYYDRSHFEKVFKNIYDITPKTYRIKYKR
ncbi:MAG: AraC family transcriptional regulator, partial [Erysipelotrichaceae bacterium]|nr:AraC family transcriptional regulator [Erysipelotrichaceae bacterium]